MRGGRDILRCVKKLQKSARYNIFLLREGLKMEKILISVPDKLAARMRAIIPARQRSKTVVHLIENEVARREGTLDQFLYECALAVEKDMSLREEMASWNVTLQDGSEDF